MSTPKHKFDPRDERSTPDNVFHTTDQIGIIHSCIYRENVNARYVTMSLTDIESL